MASWFQSLFGSPGPSAAEGAAREAEARQQAERQMAVQLEAAQAAAQAAAEAANAARAAAGAAERAAGMAMDAARGMAEPKAERSVIGTDTRVPVELAGGLESVVGNDDRLSVELELPAADIVGRDNREQVQPFIGGADEPQVTGSSVINKDTRAEVPGFGRPWCAICYLSCKFPSDANPWIGTGWLINPTTIITAGHNLWNPPRKKDEKRAAGEVCYIQVVPSQPNTLAKLKSTPKTVRYVYDERWQTAPADQRRFYDYGAIFLDHPVHLPFYFTPWAADPDAWKSYKLLHCAGYPYEKDGTLLRGEGKACGEMLTGNMFLGPKQAMVVHDIDTTGGQSGAPVFWTDPDNTEFYVLGIHTQGKGAAKGFNACLRITPAMLKAFERWKSDHNLQGPQPVS